jgi:hypothetical protein
MQIACLEARRSATQVTPDRVRRTFLLSRRLCVVNNRFFTVSTPEKCMIGESPAAAQTKPRTDDVTDFVAQVELLAARVETMLDGPMKRKLRAELADIRATVGDFKSEVRPAI